MIKRKKLISILLLNIFTSSALCFTAQFLVMSRGLTSHFDLWHFCLNFCVAYPCACLIGWLIPAPALGLAVNKRLKTSPGSFFFALIMNLCINLIFTVVMSAVMTFFNVVLLAHQGIHAFIGSYAGDFLPMYLASCAVSWLAVPTVEKWTA